MKDSPAASATLGQNPIRLKLGVFMLSAGIAGLGGALLSAALVTVDINSFTIFSSLAIVMSVVIAGIGYVSGAFTGGLLFGVAYVAIQNSFGKIGTDHGSLHGLFNWLATFTTVLPAIVGVGLGKNPSGFVSDIMNGFKPLAKAKPMIALGVAIEVLLYVLADTKNISNWWFVVGTMLLVLLWPAIARMLMPKAFKTEAAEAKSPLDVPLEMVGIDQPMTPEILAALDDELGIPAPTGEYSVVAATMAATTSATPSAAAAHDVRSTAWRETDVALLETAEITVRFGGNVALRDVSVAVEPGTVTGLIGPNGAGKTTLFNVITGLLRPQSGRVLLGDDDITRLPPYKRARKGLSRTFQRLELFTSLDVRDNVRVAGQIRNAAKFSDRLEVNARADEVIEMVGLDLGRPPRHHRTSHRHRPPGGAGPLPDDPAARRAARRTRLGPDRK